MYAMMSLSFLINFCASINNTYCMASFSTRNAHTLKCLLVRITTGQLTFVNHVGRVMSNIDRIDPLAFNCSFVEMLAVLNLYASILISLELSD